MPKLLLFTRRTSLKAEISHGALQQELPSLMSPLIFIHFHPFSTSRIVGGRVSYTDHTRTIRMYEILNVGRDILWLSWSPPETWDDDMISRSGAMETRPKGKACSKYDDDTICWNICTGSPEFLKYYQIMPAYDIRNSSNIFCRRYAKAKKIPGKPWMVWLPAQHFYD